MANAVNDIVGKPAIGTTSSGKVTGSKWQFGIAVDLNNRKFEFGKIINYTIAADNFSQSYVAATDIQAGLSASNSAINTAPGNYIQHGDKAIFGPSTNATDAGYSESIRLSGAGHDNHTNKNSWANGVLYFLDRKNKYRYELSDPITIVGTGMADGWHLRDLEGATLGIKKGHSCLNAMGRYLPNLSNEDEDSIDTWEKTTTNMDDFIGLSIKLPAHTDVADDEISGPQHGAVVAGKGPAIFNSDLAVAPWRSELYPQTPSGRTWDWAGSEASATINYFGVFRYIRDPGTSDIAKLAYNTNSTAPLNDPIGAINTYGGLLTGFVHRGGEFKDTAQALFTMVNGLSTGNPYVSTSVYSQILTRSLNDSKDAKYSKLVSGTNYRLGITYKGTLQPATGDYVDGSEAYAKFQWAPAWTGSTTNTYANSMISTAQLFNNSTRTVSNWTTAMSSGYLDAVGVDTLDSQDSIRLDIISKASSPTAYADADRSFRGAELLMFVDNVWLEHEGDVAGASGSGYIELDHYPEQGTLQTNRFRNTKPVSLTLSDGSSRTIDTTGTMHRWLYKLTASFVNVKEVEWAKIQDLLTWQDMGYKITVHPFLPGVPHCLVGEMAVNNINKSFWDLTRFSFQLVFTESG